MFKRGEAPTGFQIRAGSNRVGTGGQLVGVTRIIVHDSYNSRTLINDISILQLQRNLVLSTSEFLNRCVAKFW